MHHGGHLTHLRNYFNHMMKNYWCLKPVFHFTISYRKRLGRKKTAFARKIPSKVLPLKHAVRIWKTNFLALIFEPTKESETEGFSIEVTKAAVRVCDVIGNVDTGHLLHDPVFKVRNATELIDDTTLLIFWYQLLEHWGKGIYRK